MKELVGQLDKVNTTKDQMLRLVIDVPQEIVNFNIIPVVGQNVIVGINIEEDNDNE